MKNNKFTKNQLLGSKTLGYPVELVAAVLDKEKMYTKEEAKQEIQRYQKSQVKK